MSNVVKIIEFFLDNKDGFKNQVENNLKLSYTDREDIILFDEIEENKINTNLDEIFEESLNVLIKTLETFK